MIPEDIIKLDSIQGGKLNHMFNYSNVSGENFYTKNDFVSDEAKEAFHNGKWTIKFHGSNGFIIKDNGKLELWERRDIKNKNIDEINEVCINIDSINNSEHYKKTILPSEYNSNEKKHKYIFVKVDEKSKKGKVLYCRMLKLLENTKTMYQSIEYVGKKIQGNEKQFNWGTNENKNYGIVFHSSVESIITENNFDKIIEIAKKWRIEGWVIYHEGKAWKVRTNMLVSSSECAFDKKKETDCKPLVY